MSEKPHIAIVSASVRTGRKSHRVALYFRQYLEAGQLATTEILDLASFKFPLFDERLKYQQNPDEETVFFAGRIKNADGLIIVTPEYNGGYPASLKNAIDLVYDELRRKPVAIATASDGSFGGTQVISSLQFTLWKMRAWTVSAMFPVPKVHEAFDETGKPTDPAATEKRTAGFVGELLWCVEAVRRMNNV